MSRQTLQLWAFPPIHAMVGADRKVHRQCDEVRFEAGVAPFDVFHCHCRSGRRHNGAAMATLAG